MTAGSRWLVASALVACVAIGTASAQAPNANAAEEAFRQGRELFKANKFAEACEQFENSQKLDPAHGTMFNLAQCSERIGRLATAAAAYRELVAKDSNEQRKATAAERLKDITPRIPRLIVKLDKVPQGVVVELDSKAGSRKIAPNQAAEVDFGDYTVVVRARGYNEFMSRVKVAQEAKTTSVEATLREGASNAETVGVASGVTGDHQPGMPRRKLVAITVMAAGAGALIGGVVFGSLASSKWSEAKDVCGGTMCQTQADVDRANQLGDTARTRATISTVLVIAAVGIGGVGAYVWFTTPKGTTIAPTATESSAGVRITGQF